MTSPDTSSDARDDRAAAPVLPAPVRPDLARDLLDGFGPWQD